MEFRRLVIQATVTEIAQSSSATNTIDNTMNTTNTIDTIKTATNTTDTINTVLIKINTINLIDTTILLAQSTPRRNDQHHDQYHQ
jgi:hypothetical protein